MIRVSERLLFNDNYIKWEQVNFQWDKDAVFVLDQHVLLDFFY